MPSREPQPRQQTGVPGEADGRWNSVWRLVLQAEQLPVGERLPFMESVETDSFVIRQAIAILEGSESLLTASSLPDGTKERFVPQTGMRIGRYRVGTLLGSGGAASVYAAFDEELNRPVAIKFVSVRRSGASAGSMLPLREARAASALNHPNIIMVFEVIETNETAAIVMELVKGITLRQALWENPPLDEVLHWSTQLAQALAVAHHHGLVHGDIKPENVMVRDDGYIKLLDFGLALDAQPQRARVPQFAGTLRYLAPEHCLGQPATQASDIFALGMTLYELTTGRYPYKADGAVALLQAIALSETPRPSTFRPDLPVSLDDLILAMLARTPELRPTAQQVSEKLVEIAKHTTPERVPRSSKRTWLAGAAVASVLVTFGAAFWIRRPQARPEFSRMTVRPIASQPGLEDRPSISPDGLWVSCLYRARTSDRPILQVHSTQGKALVVIETAGLVVQGPAAWSPDSNELVFSAMEGSSEHAIYRASRTGGVPKRIANCNARTDNGCEVDWSPDGRLLVVTDRVLHGFEVYLLDLSSGRRRTLIASDPEYLTRPRFSPDGKWIAYARPASMTADELYIVPASGGKPRRIAESTWNQRSYTWTVDGKGLLSFGSRLGYKPQIWRFPLDGGAPSSAPRDLDVSRGTEPALARRKGSLVWVRDLNANSLWRMPIDRSGKQPELLVNSAAVDVDAEWSGNGRMVFRSDRSGFPELWIANADGSRPWQATRFRGPFVGDPHWSPDGREIAFTTHSTGNPDIFRMTCAEESTTCSEPRQLTRSRSTDANPVWSRDGSRIYFTSFRSGSYEVWRMAADGSAEPERMTWNGAYMARESADGKWLYYSRFEGSRAGRTGFWRSPLPSTGHAQTEIPLVIDVPYTAGATWTLSASELFYYPSVDDPAVPYPSVRALNLETGHSRDLSVGKIRLGRGLSLSPDGQWLLRSQNDRGLTLVMIAE